MSSTKAKVQLQSTYENMYKTQIFLSYQSPQEVQTLYPKKENTHYVTPLFT